MFKRQPLTEDEIEELENAKEEARELRDSNPKEAEEQEALLDLVEVSEEVIR